MVTALIADVHGNLPALRAALRDIKRRGASRILGLGDYVGKGPDSAECLKICREACQEMVYGNWDMLCSFHPNPQFAFIRDQIGPAACAWMQGLPEFLFHRIAGHTLKLFHGRPTIPATLWPDSEAALFESALQAGDGGQAEYIGVADTHHVFERDFRQHVFFNTGSVGNTCDGMPQASYALLHGEWDGAEKGVLSIEHVRVPYDAEEAAARAQGCPGLPYLEAYLHELRTGFYGRG